MNFFLDSFSKEMLEAMNKCRAKHQVPPLKWSRGLAKDAEKWAEDCAKNNTLRSADIDDGENIYGLSGRSEIKGHEPVDKWYDGIKNYSFVRPGFKSDAGNFTQLIWKSTKEVGIGKAKSAGGNVIVVARFRPAGNVMNRFEQNVMPLKSSDSPSSSTRVYTTKIEKKDSGSPRTERTVYRASDKPEKNWGDKKEDFFKKFKDLGVDHKDKDKEKDKYGKVTKETRTYDEGPGGRTVVTKTITTRDGHGGSPHSYHREIRTTYTSQDSDDFGRRGRGARKDDDEYSPKISRTEVRPSSGGGMYWGGCSAPKSSTPIDKSFKKQCLDQHNKYRAMHSAPPLKWSEDLAKQAQYYAEKLARMGCLQHAPKGERGDVGENLAMFSDRYDEAGVLASDMWYDEVKKYRFNGTWQGGTGHFTQLVWKGSKELGMGRAKTCDGRCTYVVGRYRPAGNIMNYMAENVARKK